MSQPVTLAVASAGGHLTQLLLLADRLGLGQVVCVTYHPETLATRRPYWHTIAAYHPTTKHVPNAVRNYRLARRVMAEYEVSRVVSTGAAVALPFAVRAAQLGIPVHYLESATRVNGPSLTGRLLTRVPGVHLYRQSGSWGEPRWRQGPSVFDGFDVRRAGEPATVRRIVVSLGTHDFGFERLIGRLQRLVEPRDEVLWQLGSTVPPDALKGRVVARVPEEELSAAIAEADVVVGHAGTGLTLTALRAGKVPVLVPRRRARGEHTDDHQCELAAELARRSLAVTADVGDLNRGHLERAAGLEVSYAAPPAFALDD